MAFCGGHAFDGEGHVAIFQPIRDEPGFGPGSGSEVEFVGRDASVLRTARAVGRGEGASSCLEKEASCVAGTFHRHGRTTDGHMDGTRGRGMLSTVVDTHIFVDRVGPYDAPTRDGPMPAFKSCFDEGRVMVSATVSAESTDLHPHEARSLDAASWLRPKRDGVPFAAADAVGRARWASRRRGGPRERAVRDFLIGAPALAAGHRRPTRDGGRYGTCFPTLDPIAPETHP